MCARFTLTAPPEQLTKLFHFPIPEIAPRFNVAPTQSVLAVFDDAAGRHAEMLRWGLIPHWSNDPTIGQRLINARAETAPEKPAFRDALRKRRCLIPATGFFEWLHSDVAQSLVDDIEREGPSLSRRAQAGLFDELDDAPLRPPVATAKTTAKRQPFYFTLRDGEPFAFAGLYDRWRDSGGNEIQTCTILTTTPNDIVAELHDRMPVIVRPAEFDHWLDPTVTHSSALMPFFAPFPAEEMRTYPVSTTVNNPRNEGPECVLPL